jgi:hypothetical protein
MPAPDSGARARQSATVSMHRGRCARPQPRQQCPGQSGRAHLHHIACNITMNRRRASPRHIHLERRPRISSRHAEDRRMRWHQSVACVKGPRADDDPHASGSAANDRTHGGSYPRNNSRNLVVSALLARATLEMSCMLWDDVQGGGGRKERGHRIATPPSTSLQEPGKKRRLGPSASLLKARLLSGTSRILFAVSFVSHT